MATATLADCLEKQKKESILQAPTDPSSTNGTEASAATSTTLSIALVNNTSSSTAYAYVSGLASDDDDAVYLLESDGQTVYYPTSPSSTGTALSADCSIPLGAPGTTTTITIPYTDGGRIWFSEGAALTFLLNPGPALVEPSVTNTSDPNYNIYWDFCEFTFNSTQLYVNLSYVDFVCLPIGLQLENTSGTVTTAEGLPSTGLDTVCAGLVAQNAIDGAGWNDLIITTSSGANLRALSPNSAITMNSALFSTYFDSYVQSVWSLFSNGVDLTVDTQGSWDSVEGTVASDVLSFGSSVGSFTAPTSADIFSCSTGPFATTTSEMDAIGARLAAAFNRTTLLVTGGNVQPSEAVVADYYTNPVTNHYARLMHATYLDGKGYAFPYDDVTPDGGADQSGSLDDPDPELLTVTVGGPSAASTTVRLRDTARAREGQRPGGRRQGAQHRPVRRDVAWVSAEDEKRLLASSAPEEGRQLRGSADVDPEKGLGGDKEALLRTAVDGSRGDQRGSPWSSLMARSLASLVPQAWARGPTSLPAHPESGVCSHTIRRLVALVARVASLFLSMSVRALISRVAVALFLMLMYLVMPRMSSSSPGAVDVVGTAGASQ